MIDPEQEAYLAEWLARRLAGSGPVQIRDVTQLTSGYSAETLALDAVRADRMQRVVLRRESPEPAIYPQQVRGVDVEVDIQYRAMEALSGATSRQEVPLAPLIGYEGAGSPLGTPFFVMGFVPGEVPSVSPPYPASGFFAEARPEQRHTLVERGLSVLAAMHAVDWRPAGLGWLVAEGEEPTSLRQLDIWERYSRRELRDRVHPRLDEAWAWLRAEAPARESPATFGWGDARIGNMIWQGFECRCVTDFEASCIAPPEIDVGWWMMFDRWSHELFGVARPEGEPTREEQLEIYNRESGRDLGDVRWYEVFAAARYCAIVVRVTNRSVDRGEMPADHGVWLDNPATTCLVELMPG